MKNSNFMTTAYGVVVLLISVIILSVVIIDRKKNSANCHVQN